MVEQLPPLDQTDPKQELEILLRQVDGIKHRLEAMKLKADVGIKISSADLDLAVEEIAELDGLMRPRRDTGH